MKKLLLVLCAVVLILPLLGLNACDNSGNKVKFWITQNNPDDPRLTTVVSAQSNNVTFWACGTTDEEISCKVGIFLEGKTIYFETSIITQGKDQAFAVGRVVNPLPGGDYVIKAVNKTTGELAGSLKFTVTGPKNLYPTPTTSK
jgi:hypothetical protein